MCLETPASGPASVHLPPSRAPEGDKKRPLNRMSDTFEVASTEVCRVVCGADIPTVGGCVKSDSICDARSALRNDETIDGGNPPQFVWTANVGASARAVIGGPIHVSLTSDRPALMSQPAAWQCTSGVTGASCCGTQKTPPAGPA